VQENSFPAFVLIEAEAQVARGGL